MFLAPVFLGQCEAVEPCLIAKAASLVFFRSVSLQTFIDMASLTQEILPFRTGIAILLPVRASILTTMVEEPVVIV